MTPSWLKPLNVPGLNCQRWVQNHEFMLMLGCLLVGSLLRLIWAADMEWKQDELWMYETVRRVIDGEQPWPWLGMPSSAGLLNPGLSVWCFIALGYLAPTPLAMVRGVQILNIAALGLMFGFCLQVIPAQQERRIWLWGLALASLSPLAIVFSRKIWAQDILPIVCVGLIISHWYRHRRWGAFGWGLLGALIGQIHMSGFFLAAGLWGWTLYAHWRWPHQKRVCWGSWLLGSAIGLLPFIPWLLYAMNASGSAARSWVGVVVPKFYLHWWTTGLGVNLSYSLGRHFYSDFLPLPTIAGRPTYLVGLAHLILLGLGLAGLRGWLRSGGSSDLGSMAATDFYLKAVGLATGLVFTLFGLNIPIHYLIVTFPFIYIWMALIHSHRPLLWLVMLGCQLLISVAFLWLIHQTGGYVDADYGLTYRIQMGLGEINSN